MAREPLSLGAWRGLLFCISYAEHIQKYQEAHTASFVEPDAENA